MLGDLQRHNARTSPGSTYLAPEHHRRTLPEALVGLASPVADHPLEDGVLGEHEQDADDDADDEQQVESGVLVRKDQGQVGPGAGGTRDR